jgi:hypothetical protein
MKTTTDVLRRDYNLARTAFYRNQTEANERRMDDALRALLAKEVRQDEMLRNRYASIT